MGSEASVKRSKSSGNTSPGRTTSHRPRRRPVPLYVIAALIAGGFRPVATRTIASSGVRVLKETFTSVNENGVRAPPPDNRQVTGTYSSGPPDELTNLRT